MFDWSPQTAENVYYWANIATVGGGIIAAFGSIALFVSGVQRDKFSADALMKSQQATEKLRKQIAPRTVTEAQKIELQESLSGLLATVELTWPMGDSEAEHFTRKLKGALAEADLSVSASPSGFGGSQPLEGATIHAADAAVRDRLTKALKAIGLDVQEGDLPARNPYIVVGPKRREADSDGAVPE